MGKDKINSSELKRNICLKTGHFEFDEVSEEDLTRVYEIALRGVKFNGEESDANIYELSELSNLRELSLQTFEFDPRIIEFLKSLGLKTFHMVNGKTDEPIDLDFGEEIEKLDIKSSEGLEEAKIVSPEVLYISDSKVDFSKIDLSKARSIYLQDCVIVGYDDPSKNEALEYINFDGSTVTDREGKLVTEFALRDGIYITHEEETRKEDLLDRE